jgi:predicted nucleic acid-binding protein
MKKVFIDANIYLNFFDSNKPELKKLLDSLLEIKDSLFVNSQIAHEINRNKLDIAQRSFGNHFNNLSNLKLINLPEHLELESNNLQSWNSQSKKINRKQKELQNQLEKIIQKTLEEIMCSADKVSQTFRLLFEGALEASEVEIEAERHRKEIGNPPGKANDPLGDQISWEQFLNCSTSSEKIWIITKDSDYYTVFKNKRYLNPFLYNELVVANIGNPSIFCFESLAEGLKHFNENSSEKIKELPTEEELKTITEEELSDLATRTENSRFFHINEQERLTHMYLPPGFKSPNQYLLYLQYLRRFDSEE